MKAYFTFIHKLFFFKFIIKIITNVKEYKLCYFEKSNYKVFIAFCIVICFSLNIRATHLMGAQIWYVNTGKYKYDIYADMIRDCRGVPMGSPTFNFYSSLKSSSQSSSIVSITDITPTCSKIKKPCNPPNTTHSGNGVELLRYKTSVDFSSWASIGVGIIEISITQCCRSSAITTGASGLNFYLQAMIDISKTAYNNSPKFYSDPFLFIKCNNPLYYNISAYDMLENDSLSFEFINPLQNYKTNTNWSGSFSYDKPFTLYCKGSCKPPKPNNLPPSGLYLDNYTGDMIFTPTDCNETTITCVKISEYRKNSSGKYELIGYITRDWQTFIINMNGNNVPRIWGPSSVYLLDSVYSEVLYKTNDAPFVTSTGSKVMNDSLTFEMKNIFVDSSNAIFNIIDKTQRNPSAIFGWKPLGKARAMPYILSLKATDNNCDLNSSSYKTVKVYVRKKSSLAWVEGYVFNDINNNCQRDSFEKELANTSISIDGNFSTLFRSDSTGFFSGWVPIGKRTFTLLENNDTTKCKISLNIQNGKTYFVEIAGISNMNISGAFYNDTNRNCKIDSSEMYLSNKTVVVEPGGYIANSDNYGKWKLSLPGGEYKVMYYPNKKHSFITCPLKYYEISIFNDTSFKNLNFALADSQQYIDLDLSLISSNRIERGEVFPIILAIKNVGDKKITSKVSLKFNKKLKYSSASLSYDFKTDSTIQWSFSNLKPDTQLLIKLFLKADSSTNKEGDTMTIRSWLDTMSLKNDIDKNNNKDELKISIFKKVENNTKQELITNGFAWREGNKLRYLIKFQNTTSDTIKNILIIDTLHYNLIKKSIKINGSSHPYSYNINQEILSVLFKNINLPDSASTSQNSIGFFDFSIEINPKINNEFNLFNYATIVFDDSISKKTDKIYIKYTSYINTGKTNQNQYCTGDSMFVSYLSYFKFNAGNKLKLILSDKNGDFINGITIDSLNTTNLSGTFRVKLPNNSSSGNFYKVKIISTHPYGSILKNGTSNSFKIYNNKDRPTLKYKDTLYCGKDSVNITLNSIYPNHVLYDLSTKIDSFGQKQNIQIKLKNGKHYLHTSSIINGCKIYSDTLKFVNDTIPNAELLCLSNQFLQACKKDSVMLQINGVKRFDLLGNANNYLASYSKNIIKIIIQNDGDLRSIKGYSDYGCIDTSNSLKFKLIDSSNKPVFVYNDTLLCNNDSTDFVLNSPIVVHNIYDRKQKIDSLTINTKFKSKLKPGYHYFIAKGIITNTCSITSDTFKFISDTLPKLNLSSPSHQSFIVCVKDSVTLFIEGAKKFDLIGNGSYIGTYYKNTIKTEISSNNETRLVKGYSNYGCTDYSNTLKFKKFNNPTVTMSISDSDYEICEEDSVTFTGKGAIKYQLYKNDTAWLSTFKSSITSKGIKNKDSFNIVGTDANGCKGSSSSISLIVKAAPKIVLKCGDLDLIICKGNQVVLSFSGGNNYQLYKNGKFWTTPSKNPYTANSIQHNDEIFVQGFSLANGCVGTSNLLKFGVSDPQVNLKLENYGTICNSDTVFFSFQGAIKYDVYKNKSFLTTTSFQNYSSSKFNDMDEIYIEGTDTFGCKAKSNEITLNLDSVPTINLINLDIDNTNCLSDTVRLIFNGGIKYDIFKNDSLWKKNITINKFETNGLLNNDKIYIIGYTNSGCKDTSQNLNFTIFPLPKILVTNYDSLNFICKNDLVNFKLKGGKNYDVYKNNSYFQSTNDSIFKFKEITNKDSIFIIGIDNNLCKNSSNKMKFYVNEKPNIIITSKDYDSTLCENEKVELLLSGGINYEIYKNNYYWLSSSENKIFLSNIKNKDTIYAIGFDKNKCFDKSDSIVFEFLKKPNILIKSTDPDNIICDDDSVTLLLYGSSTFDLYKNNNIWKKQISDTIKLSGLQNKDSLFAVGKASNNCTDTSETIKLIVFPNPSQPTIRKSGDTLYSSFTKGNQWFNESKMIIGATNNYFIPTKSSTYFVLHTGEGGCQSPFSDGFKFVLITKNIFSGSVRIYPNPASDYLIIENTSNEKLFLEITDVYGRLIKEEIILGNLNKLNFNPSKGIYFIKLINSDGFIYNNVIQFE